MLHRLGLRTCGDDLLVARGLGVLLAPHLLGLGLERGFLHALVLQLQRVAHLLGLELFGQQLLHAGAVVGRQVDLADLHRAQHDAVGGELGLQLGLDRLLDIGALAGEDLAHRVAREHLVDDALHGGLDDLAVAVVRQVPRHRCDARRVQRIAHRQVHADRQAFHRLERRFAVGLHALQRPVDLVAQGISAQLVQPGDHPHAALAELARAPGQGVAAHAQLAMPDRLHRRQSVEPVADGRDSEAGDDRAARVGELGKGRGERAVDGVHHGVQAIGHDLVPPVCWARRARRAQRNTLSPPGVKTQ